MFNRFRLLLAASSLAALPSTGAAADTSRYAAFVVNQDTGVVMHSRRSQAERHPASLTKMMTLYMLFQAIEEGEIGLDDQISVSAQAAAAPPSELALRAGDRIRVEDAILALVVKSANDVAVAVGERLSGSEARFAEHMTTRAEALGLERTNFENASGLPNREQVTTARDMARLGIALQRDFPQYFHYFDTEEFRYNGRTYRNHNSLVGRVDGVTGLKTGYIRASGFNVVVSAERDENRLIAVIMGGPSASARDAHAEELLEAAFDSLEQRQDLRRFADLSVPRLNPVREQVLIAQDINGLGLPAPVEMGSAQTAPPLRVIIEDEPLDPVRAPARDSQSIAPAGGLWSVQIGAYRSADRARQQLDAAEPLSDRLFGAQPMTRAVDTEGGRLWRARFETLSATDALAICADLSAHDHPCFTVAPGR